MAWTKVGNIKGKRGSIWFQGSGPPPATVTGSQAGDLYLDVDAGDVYSLT